MSKLIICDEKIIIPFFQNDDNCKTLIIDLNKETVDKIFNSIDSLQNISAIDVIMIKDEQNMLFKNNIKLLSSKYNKHINVISEINVSSNYVDKLEFNAVNNLSENTKNNLINKYGLKMSDFDNIKDIKTTLFSVALLKKDGKIVTFGLNNYYSNKNIFYIDEQATELYSNKLMFCAKNIRDKYLFWGNSNGMQIIPSFVDVKQIFTSCDKFTALKNNDDVAMWGLQTNIVMKKPEYIIKDSKIYVLKNINEIYMGINKNKNRNLIIDKRVKDELSNNKNNFIKLVKHALVN